MLPIESGLQPKSELAGAVPLTNADKVRSNDCIQLNSSANSLQRLHVVAVCCTLYVDSLHGQSVDAIVRHTCSSYPRQPGGVFAVRYCPVGKSGIF